MPITINHLAQAGDVLARAGQPALALDFWLSALECAPDDPVLLTGAAVTLRAMREPDRAEEFARRAVAIEPTARRRTILACAIHDQFRFDEAIEAMRAICDSPHGCQLPVASCQLKAGADHGGSQLATGNLETGNFADAWGLLGIWLLERWQFRDATDDPLLEAIARLDRAVELAPENKRFLVSRVSAYLAAERLGEAIADTTRLVGRYPAIPEFHVHRAAARMKRGELVRGYQEFGDWSYRMERVASHPFASRPRWSPELRSESNDVYLWNTEGAGDHFQYIRFAQPMAADGWAVRAIANPTMDRLLERVPGVAGTVGEDVEIPADALLAPMPALPAAYVGSAPLWSGAYLSADEATTAGWRERLRTTHHSPVTTHPTLRVGLAWRGNPKQANDERRSFDVGRLAPLFGLPGVSLVSLQHGHVDELAALNYSHRRSAERNVRLRRSGLTTHHSPVLDLGEDYQKGDWLDTAGVIANLDLVIAPCTAIAHLAGAMGKPVWLALSEPGCWRWMRERTDSPWYPSMRIFRQSRRGSWDGVFEAMAEQLVAISRTAA